LGIPGVKPQYNFLWPAQGVRYGIELTKWF